MPDNVIAPFVMYGARDALAAGLVHIERQIDAIERAVVGEPGLAFDLAKTLVESTCRTVLADRSVPYSDGDDLPQLFRSVRQTLPFLPPTAGNAAEVRASLDRTLNGLNTAIQGVCELRNQCGFASHGAGEPRPAMEGVQALLAAEAADAIVGFLYRVHRQDRTRPPTPVLRFEENGAFNDYLDGAFGPFTVFESEFRASEVLFQLEPETYRIYLAEFDNDSEASAAPVDHEVRA